MANPKSNINHTLTLTGELNLAEAIITETVKDLGDVEYPFLELLREFDGKEITLAVKEKRNISSVIE